MSSSSRRRPAEPSPSAAHADWLDRPRLLRATALAGLVILAAYLPVLTARYGFYDDYHFLASVLSGDGDVVWRQLDAAGRPLNGALLVVGFGMVDGISGLAGLRLVGVLGLVGLAVAVTAWARYLGARSTVAAGFGVSLCVLPSAYLVASWTQLFAMPYVILATLLSWHLVERGYEAGTRSRRLALFAGAAAGLLLGALTYQPYTLFYASFCAVALLIRPRPLRRLVPWLALHLAAIGSTLLISLLYVRTRESPNPRSALVEDLGGKLAWYVREPLPHAFAVFPLPSSNALAIVLGSAAAAGVVLRLRRRLPRWRDVAASALGLVGLLLLSSLAMLVVAENWASYRSLYPLAALALALVGAGVGELLGLMRRSRMGNAAWHALLVVPLLAAGLAHQQVSRLVVDPQAAEVVVAELQLGSDGAPAPAAIVVVPSSYTDTPAPFSLYDEFGIPSSYPEGSARAMIWLLAQERHPAWELPQSRVRVGDGGSESLVIDMSQLGRVS